MGLFRNHVAESTAALAQPVQVYEQRPNFTAQAPRPYMNAQPVAVATHPIYPDSGNTHNSYFYAEGRDPAHQKSRVTTPLNFNKSFGSLFQWPFVPGARVSTDALVAVPRNRNRGIQPFRTRAIQVRPAATSYGGGGVIQLQNAGEQQNAYLAKVLG